VATSDRRDRLPLLSELEQKHCGTVGCCIPMHATSGRAFRRTGPARPGKPPPRIAR